MDAGRIPDDTIGRAEKNVRDILAFAMEYQAGQDAVVVFDTDSPLAEVLTQAYRRCLPGARFLDFGTTGPQAVREVFDTLAPSSLVVLIQSVNFRLDDFRIRVELFKRSLKVIEHLRLGRMRGDEADYYIESLAYDPAYYRGVGRALKERLDRARRGVVDSGGEQLVFDAFFEAARLNIGDYSQMKNAGGQFPIGEVFTEARDLEAVNGRIRIFAFGDTTFTVNKPEKPIILEVNRGRVTGVRDSTEEFDRVLAKIREDEGAVWVRELGFGLNPAFTQERLVPDIGTYERMCGIHLSLGAKHGLYKKPGFKEKEVKHHVDVFAVTECVTLDEETVFQNGRWIPGRKETPA